MPGGSCLAFSLILDFLLYSMRLSSVATLAVTLSVTLLLQNCLLLCIFRSLVTYILGIASVRTTQLFIGRCLYCVDDCGLPGGRSHAVVFLLYPSWLHNILK